MDDNTKILNQNVQAQPVVPIGSFNKEVGPISAPVAEFIKPSETDPLIDKDIAELGVEVKKDQVNITDEHRGIVEHAKQFTPTSSPTSSKVTMPMSDEEIDSLLKTGQDDDSKKGLAILLDKLRKIFRL